MASFSEKFTQGSYPIRSPLEAKPTGLDLYSRFFLAGALCW